MKKRPRIHIGTSGWEYRHWEKEFYMQRYPSGTKLESYSKSLTTVEINNTFYQLPDKEKLRKWARTVPSHFTFAVKASRYITHIKKMKNPKVSIKRFFSRISVLKEKLGPILFQLPPVWKCNCERLREFINVLPDGFRYVFEFRNKTWINQDVLRILKQNNMTFCMYDLGGWLSPKEITSDLIYVRLHGPGNPYEGSYTASVLAGWAGAFHAWAKKGHTVYCYFDNDQNAYAPLNALKLQEMIQGD